MKIANFNEQQRAGDHISDFGNGVFVSQGSFTIEGGTIYNCLACAAGGGVYVSGGSFTMNGGVIDSCFAPSGGSVCVESGSFTMEGGVINMAPSTVVSTTVVLLIEEVVLPISITPSALT